MAPPPPQLMDELIEAILLFFPADDPASLVRAALVCKTWLRIVSAPGFSRRFRELRHGAMLGVFVNLGDGGNNDDIARFVPTSFSCPPLADRSMSRVLDSRHGRVLLHNKHVSPREFLVVWDPVTDEQHVLPELQLCHESRAWNAAVLCPSATPGRRGSGPFLVVFVGIANGHLAHHCIYSSDSTSWSEPTSHHIRCFNIGSGDVVGPSLLIGDVLHFTVGRVDGILRYDVGRRALSAMSWILANSNMCLVTLESGRQLGRWGMGAAIADGNSLSLWRCIGVWAWSRHRDIKLDITEFRVLGFAESADAVLVSTDDGIFMVELMTSRTRKVCGREEDCIYSVVPHLGFVHSRH